MTPEKIRLVQQSFRNVVPIADQAASLFYSRLFELDPELRQMFPEELGPQKRKLIAALATAVGSLDNLDNLGPTLTALGAKHEQYGVKSAHYTTVGQALIDTLAGAFGNDWNSDLTDAWTEVYQIVSTMMQAGAAMHRSMARAAA